MKLYECDPKSYVRIVSKEAPHGPPAGIEPQKDEVYLFYHVDGLYSYCRDSKNRVVHLPAYAEVEIVEDDHNG